MGTDFKEKSFPIFIRSVCYTGTIRPDSPVEFYWDLTETEELDLLSQFNTISLK